MNPVNLSRAFVDMNSVTEKRKIIQRQIVKQYGFFSTADLLNRGSVASLGIGFIFKQIERSDTGNRQFLNT